MQTYTTASSMQVNELHRQLDELPFARMSPKTEGHPKGEALREVSIEGCSLLGHGYCASVYKLDPEHVIKVYDQPRHSHDLEIVTRERDISRRVFLAGLPSVITFDVVKCNGYYAAIYELVDGDTLGNTIHRDPSLLEPLVTRLAEIGLQMHSIPADPEVYGVATDMFTKRRGRLVAILTDEELASVDALVAAIPDRNTLVHGDYHVENVMVRAGELVLIDVGGFTHGHPLFDLLCLYMKTAEPGYLKTALDTDTCIRIWECYLRRYFGDKLTHRLRDKLISILSLFTDLFMLPGECATAKRLQQEGDKEAPKSLQEILSNIRRRLDRILKITPDDLTALFTATDELFS